ncbi:hypothetical protein ACFLZS_01430, partial [Patescibacteria group bacterium]
MEAGEGGHDYNVSMRILRWTGEQLNLGTIESVAGDDTTNQRESHSAIRYRPNTSEKQSSIDENEIIITWKTEYENPAYYRTMAIGYTINSSGNFNSSIAAAQISRTFTSEAIAERVASNQSGVEGPMVAITENGKAMIVWTADYDTGKTGGDKDVYGRVYSTSEFFPSEPEPG